MDYIVKIAATTTNPEPKTSNFVLKLTSSVKLVDCFVCSADRN